ncbi:hypothetical protein [Nonomuraea sp. NPDC001699]
MNRPGIRLATHRRLRIPRLGEVRLHDSAKRPARLLARGEAVVQSVTVSRGGDRWYAGVLCTVGADLPQSPRRAVPGLPGRPAALPRDLRRPHRSRPLTDPTATPPRRTRATSVAWS